MTEFKATTSKPLKLRFKYQQTKHVDDEQEKKKKNSRRPPDYELEEGEIVESDDDEVATAAVDVQPEFKTPQSATTAAVVNVKLAEFKIPRSATTAVETAAVDMKPEVKTSQSATTAAVDMKSTFKTPQSATTAVVEVKPEFKTPQSATTAPVHEKPEFKTQWSAVFVVLTAVVPRRPRSKLRRRSKFSSKKTPQVEKIVVSDVNSEGAAMDCSEVNLRKRKSVVVFDKDEEKSSSYSCCNKSFETKKALCGHMRCHGKADREWKLRPSTTSQTTTMRGSCSNGASTSGGNCRADSKRLSNRHCEAGYDSDVVELGRLLYLLNRGYPVDFEDDKKVGALVEDRVLVVEKGEGIVASKDDDEGLGSKNSDDGGTKIVKVDGIAISNDDEGLDSKEISDDGDVDHGLKMEIVVDGLEKDESLMDDNVVSMESENLVAEPEHEEMETEPNFDQSANKTCENNQTVTTPSSSQIVVTACPPLSVSKQEELCENNKRDIEDELVANVDATVSDFAAEAKRLKTVESDKEYKCSTCNKSFSSPQALGGHSASHNNKGKTIVASSQEINADISNIACSNRLHKCNFCDQAFPSGQALGGHKRKHFQGPVNRLASQKPANNANQAVVEYGNYQPQPAVEQAAAEYAIFQPRQTVEQEVVDYASFQPQQTVGRAVVDYANYTAQLQRVEQVSVNCAYQYQAWSTPWYCYVAQPMTLQLMGQGSVQSVSNGRNNRGLQEVNYFETDIRARDDGAQKLLVDDLSLVPTSVESGGKRSGKGLAFDLNEAMEVEDDGIFLSL